MAVKREKIHFETVEELLGAPVEKDMTTEIKIDQIFPFENHPFKVIDDDKMQDLIQSIKDNGIIVPVLVRPDDEGTYEMISGHRRMHAARIAGLVTIPAIIKPMTNDEATIAMVDANMQREEILPSERAFSLKMKMDALRRQGSRTDLKNTSDTEYRRLNSAEKAGENCGLKEAQVRKYVRLTNLIPEFMDYVDQKRITIRLGYEISGFDRNIQKYFYEYYKQNGILYKEQMLAIKEQDNLENLTQYTINQLMSAACPEVKDSGKVSLSRKTLDGFFPKGFSADKRRDIILELLEKWKNSREG
ncbi:chromosome partitioning protein, ParB family [Lachnospiraceae bacterium]|nr:chromosome partitioning protein, ParB family [Lachnospiraceae bacterium]